VEQHQPGQGAPLPLGQEGRCQPRRDEARPRRAVIVRRADEEALPLAGDAVERVERREVIRRLGGPHADAPLDGLADFAARALVHARQQRLFALRQIERQRVAELHLRRAEAPAALPQQRQHRLPCRIVARRAVGVSAAGDTRAGDDVRIDLQPHGAAPTGERLQVR